MSLWGLDSPWGLPDAFWGVDGDSEICAFVQTRILSQMDSTVGNRNFRDFMCIVAQPFGDFDDVAEDVADAFNLDTAVGVQLDVIGAVIDLPRSGFTDDEFYRKLLKMQATILMGQTDGDWTGSVNQILSMVRTFIGAGGGPILYTALPPYSFQLDIPASLTGPEFAVLFRLLCRAIYAGVLGFFVIVPPGDNLWGWSGGATTNTAQWGWSGGATVNPGLWSGVLTTESC